MPAIQRTRGRLGLRPHGQFPQLSIREVERFVADTKQAFYSKQNPEVLQAAIEFFYSENYREATGGKAATSTCSVVFHARVYDVAEYLQAPGLMFLAADKFQKACEDLWASDGFALLAKAIYCGTELDGRLFKNDHDELHIRFLTVAKAHAADLFRFQAVGRSVASN